MRTLFLLVLSACAAPPEPPPEWDSAAPVLARIRPAKPWGPVAEPEPGADGVLAEEKIPCIREGGFMKRCPPREKCVYDRSEDGTKGAAYCVDSHGEPTGNVPSFRGRLP